MQAKQKKKEDDVAHRAAEEGLVAAKSSYEDTSSDLREVAEELRRLEFLIHKRQSAGGE